MGSVTPRPTDPTKDSDSLDFDGFIKFCKSSREETSSGFDSTLAPTNDTYDEAGQWMDNLQPKKATLPQRRILSPTVPFGANTDSITPSPSNHDDPEAGLHPSLSKSVSWHPLDESDSSRGGGDPPANDHQNKRPQRLRSSSSIAERIHNANDSIEDGSMWGVAVTIGLALLSMHGLSYVIVEYGWFKGDSEYPFNMPKEPSDNEFSMTDTVPTAKLNNHQFQLYMAFVMYGTVVLTGLGAEYLVWRMFLNGDWDQGKENKWRVAQFVFPILMGSAVGLATQGNFLCLPILAASMWKLGFPETILLIASALYEKEQSIVKRFVDLMEGVGTAVHHSSSTLYVTTLLFHVLKPTPDILSVLPPVLIQHWFVLLKYNHRSSYIIIEVILEIWFEWTGFSTLEKAHKQHWIGGLIWFSMVIAHWCYFGAGLIGMLFLKDEEEDVVTTNLADNFHIDSSAASPTMMPARTYDYDRTSEWVIATLAPQFMGCFCFVRFRVYF